MRDIKNRPRYVSQWTKQELVDGMSRSHAVLAECKFTHHRIVRALVKRGFKHTTVMATRRQNRAIRKRHTEELRTRCGMLNTDQWNSRLMSIVQGTADLRASHFQACRKSVERVTRNVRAGLNQLGALPGLEATWILGWWAFLLKHRDMRTADIGLAMLWAKVEECREQRIEKSTAGRGYNIR